MFMRFHRCLTILSVLLVALMAAPSRAVSEPAPLDEAESGSLLLKGPDGAVRTAPRVDTVIQATVTGNVVRAFVTQDFQNPTDQWVEGLYAFPMSATAAVDELEMHVGERVVRGEIRERDAARAEYKEAARAGKQASLVEAERPNLFTTAVANIAPHANIRVIIGYFDKVEYRDSAYRLHLPLAITPRYAPDRHDPLALLSQRVAPRAQKASIEVELRTGFALATIDSPHHAVKITRRDDAALVSLAEGSVPQDRDFDLVWRPETAPATQAAAFVQKFGGADYALITLLPPDLGTESTLAREVIYIIDTSGSMQGPSISQAKEALSMGLESLKPQDRFNVIRFSDTASSLFDRTRPADADALTRAREFVGALQADGGTEMLAALQIAFSMPPTPGMLRQIVFITDGAVSNEDQLMQLIRAQLGSTRLFTVGIGAAPNAYFMQEAAAAGRGSYTFVADGKDVRERMGDLLVKLSQPALTDLRLQWPAGDQADLALPLPGDLYVGDPITVVARLPDLHARFIVLTGNGASGPFTAQIPLLAVEVTSGISKLWARERIRSLEREATAHGAGETLRAQILPLALEHHLVSRFTSLVAVEQLPVRPAGESVSASVIPATAPAGGAWATTGFARTATPAPLWIAAGCALWLLALASWMSRTRRPS